MDVGAEIWVAFGGGCLVLVLIDLLLLHRRSEEVSLSEATSSTVAFVGIAMAFGVVLGVAYGARFAGEFYAGYLLELSLSVDNVFVFALVFAAFAVPSAYQRRVLFWGVLLAFVLRGVFVAAGNELLHRFSWVEYAFGLLLLFSAFRILRGAERTSDPRHNAVVRLMRRVLPTTRRLQGQRLFIRASNVPPDERPARSPLVGGWYATPLLAVLLTIELSDVVFAVDSIPAIFGVTREPFIVFSATALAILGLRSMYFLLAGAIRRFEYLNTGLAVILAFVGARFLLNDVVEIPTWVSLSVIVSVLAVSVGASVMRHRAAVG